MITVFAALAGGAGAAARLLLDGVVRDRLRTQTPVGTTVINVTGSLALGLVTGLVLFHGAPSSASLVAGTGFLGGYTTFSTASFEGVRLLQQHRLRAASAHLAANVLGALALAGAGLAVAAL